MVLLGSVILEKQRKCPRRNNHQTATELDKQNRGIFHRVGRKPIKRTTSWPRPDGNSRARPSPAYLLTGSQVRQEKRRGTNFEHSSTELEATASQTVGEVFVFVDECHRTQSGKAESRDERR